MSSYIVSCRQELVSRVDEVYTAYSSKAELIIIWTLRFQQFQAHPCLVNETDVMYTE